MMISDCSVKMANVKIALGFRFVMDFLLLIFLALGIMVYYRTLQNEEEKRKRLQKSLVQYHPASTFPSIRPVSPDPLLDRVPVSPDMFNTQTQCNDNCKSRHDECRSQLSGNPRADDICDQEIGECFLKCSRGDYKLLPPERRATERPLPNIPQQQIFAYGEN